MTYDRTSSVYSLYRLTQCVKASEIHSVETVREVSHESNMKMTYVKRKNVIKRLSNQIYIRSESDSETQRAISAKNTGQSNISYIHRPLTGIKIIYKVNSQKKTLLKTAYIKNLEKIFTVFLILQEHTKPRICATKTAKY